MEAKMDTNQEKMDAWLEEIKAWQEEMTAYEEPTEACLDEAETNPEKKAGLVEMEVAVDVSEERLDKMDTADLEANREKSDAVADYLEVPKEEAALEDRCGDRHLAVGRWWVPKEVGRRAVPARHKGRCHKGLPVEKRRWTEPECNNGREERGARRKLRLKNEKKSGRIFRKTVELESGFDWATGSERLDTVEGSSPKRPKHSPQKRTKMVLVQLNRLAPHQGTARVARP
jgi:hypothetical protein